jgi:hypothetical protein
MRKILATIGAVATIGALAAPAAALSGSSTIGSGDDRVTRHRYVRHDGGTDAAIQICNSTAPADYGNNTVNNEPFSVVDPQNPNLIISGWNDYCSDWMGLGFSTDGGQTWTNSLVPGYPADTSAEGMESPEYLRTNTASDPLGAFDTHGHFYFGAISYNGFAGPKTNADMWVARYDVVNPSTNHGYPLDYLDTVRVGKGTPSANFFGKFLDKPMIEVDRTGGRFDGNVYACFTKFPGAGQSEIYFAASSDGGRTFTMPVSISKRQSGQGCDIAVEHDGDVYVSWRDFETSSSKKNFGVSMVRSSDGGLTFGKVVNIVELTAYNPFDTARDCGDGADACPSEFVFHRVPLEPRLTADPTGQLPGIYSTFQAVDPATVVPSATSYSSAGIGSVGQGMVWVSRSLDNGRTWSAPFKISPSSVGHQYFPDVDALAGRLVAVWQDSRTDPCYSVQRPVGNTAGATACASTNNLNTYAAVSTNGTSFLAAKKVSSIGQQPQYEMFDAASVPFLGDYNWIQLVQRTDGSLFGYMTWTDNRDVVPGTDPRETTQDGFDVESGWQLQPDGTYTRQFNLGGYDQNIYGNTISIP